MELDAAEPRRREKAETETSHTPARSVKMASHNVENI